MIKGCFMRATFLKILLGCLIGFWALNLYADNATPMLTSDHPDTYRVKEGDTLWDIAAKFLNDPWKWSEVWQASPGIQNPNLIYPGDIVMLSMDGEKPRLTVQRNSHDVKEIKKDERTVKLSPRVRILPAAKAIPTIPYSEIGPFLSETRVLPVGALDKAPKIIAVDEERLLVSEGSRFYTKPLPNKPGDLLSVLRPGKVLKHPKTGALLGQEAIYLGSVVVEKNASTTSLLVRKSVKEMLPGDRLCPVEEDRIEPYFFPKRPEGAAHGYILSVLGGINQISQSQVVIISGGRNQDRKEGDVLAILQTKEDVPTREKRAELFQQQLDKSHKNIYEFAPIKVGRMIVFKVFNQTSMALVMDATRAIYLQDEVESP